MICFAPHFYLFFIHFVEAVAAMAKIQKICYEFLFFAIQKPIADGSFKCCYSKNEGKRDNIFFCVCDSCLVNFSIENEKKIRKQFI